MSRCSSEEHKGFYFGYFWVWYMSAQIIGNFTGALLIEKETGVGFFIIMSIFAIVCSLGFCFLKKPHEFIIDPLSPSEIIPTHNGQ